MVIESREYTLLDLVKIPFKVAPVHTVIRILV